MEDSNTNGKPPGYILYRIETGEELATGDDPHVLVDLAQGMNNGHWGLVDGRLDEIMAEPSVGIEES